jgi:hypothetical protein
MVRRGARGGVRLVLAAALVVLALPAAPAHAIYNGYTPGAGSFPFAVRLAGNGTMCSGSLIRADAVLTAGHCGRQLTRATIGYATGHAVVARVRKTVRHPSFADVNSGSGSTVWWDAEIVLLDRPLPGPVVVLSDLHAPGTWTTVVGYGCGLAPENSDGCSAEPTRHQQAESAKIVASTTNRFCHTLPYTDMCLRQGRSSINLGDSGGPVLWQSGGVWHEVALSSVGDDKVNLRPGADYFAGMTSVFRIHPWIRSTLAANPSISVSPTASLRLTPSPVVVGEQVLARYSVTGVPAGGTSRLQRRSGTGWLTVARLAASRHRHSLVATRSGTWTYRVVVSTGGGRVVAQAARSLRVYSAAQWWWRNATYPTGWESGQWVTFRRGLQTSCGGACSYALGAVALRDGGRTAAVALQTYQTRGTALTQTILLADRETGRQMGLIAASDTAIPLADSVRACHVSLSFAGPTTVIEKLSGCDLGGVYPVITWQIFGGSLLRPSGQ